MLNHPRSKLLANHGARHRRLYLLVFVIGTVMVLLHGSSSAYAYSVLAHEAIIDSAWEKIRTLLLRRFPNATPEELRTAHGYTYGGSLAWIIR